MVILPRLPEWWLINIACLRTGNTTVTTQLSLFRERGPTMFYTYSFLFGGMSGEFGRVPMVRIYFGNEM